LSTAAESLYQAGEYGRTREAWTAALNLIQSGRDHAAEARILTSLGLTEWRLGDYKGARARTEEARTILEAHGPRVLLPRTYNALGLIAWDQGRLSEAAELWQRTMEIAHEVGDQEYVDKPAMNLGLWYAGIGDLARAWESFDASLGAGRRLKIRPLELRSLVNLAMVANRMGEPRLALAWLDSASAAGVEEDFLAEDNYRSQLAAAAWAMGDPGVALAGLDSGVRKARRSGLRQSEAANLTLMADIYWEAGDLARALGLHAEAEAIHGELDLPTEQGQNLHSAARIRAAMGQRQQAEELVSRALTLHQRSEDLGYQLDDHLLLAELGAVGHLGEARRLAARLATRLARTKVGLAEARVAAGAGKPHQVLQALAASATDLGEGLSSEISEAEALRARSYGSLKQWDSAATAGRRAVAAVERAQRTHGSTLLRASYASSRTGIYADLVKALLALGQTDEAFALSDAPRGGSGLGLGSSELEHRSTFGSPGVELLRRIGLLENEIGTREEEGLEAGELRDQLRRTEREYELAHLSAGGRPAGAGQLDGRTSAIRDALGADELMLAYLVAPEELFVFSVTRQGIEVQVVPVRAQEIEARVRLARQLLADPTVPAEEAGPVLRTLSQWLLGPLERQSGARRLVIVPHGALAYLPFGALKTRAGEYLVQRYSLVHLPSAGFASRRETQPSPPTGGAFEVTALAPLPRALPATASEVRALGRSQHARVLLGREASESALRQALRSGTVAHVATHGVLNGMNPLFSRIELAPGRPGSTIDDGRLEVHEVLGLEIQSPLVFLSGCETGLGPGASRRYSPGEDYATLAAAFLSAGARQVVATLWAIPDTGAAVFASRFYRELGRTGTAEALASAQRALLTERRFRHPYYWAGYRLAGLESIQGRAVS
jgi:CHAT domain-containing protein/tetratricopeptide (TPR) repeat protein